MLFSAGLWLQRLTRIKNLDLLDLFWHGLGFVAPALVLAPAMVGVNRWLDRKRAPALSWQAQTAINFVACLAVLVAGLVLTGHDGRMAPYAALVAVAAATPWALGAWRR